MYTHTAIIPKHFSKSQDVFPKYLWKSEHTRNWGITCLWILYCKNCLIQDCFKQIHVLFGGGFPTKFFGLFCSTLSKCLLIF